MTRTVDDIRREMTTKLLCFYRPPAHIEGEGQGAAYVGEVVAAFAEMRPTEFEWDHVWSEFRRTWTKAYWPLPSDFCARLGAFRARAASIAQAGGLVTARAEAGARSPPYHHATYLAACNRASFMASSPNPDDARWGRLLCGMATALNATRDDTDQPRDPARRAMEQTP